MKALILAAALLLVACTKDKNAMHSYTLKASCGTCAVVWSDRDGGNTPVDVTGSWERSGEVKEGNTLRVEAHHTTDTLALIVQIFVDGEQVEMDWGKKPIAARTHYYVR